MGRYNVGAIEKFWPDDTETTMYLVSNTEYSITDIIEKINNKWSNASLDDVTITSEKIHTDCLTYDLYDSGDYTDFLIITFKGSTQ